MKKIIPLVAAFALSAASFSASATDLFYTGIKSGNMDINPESYDTEAPLGIQLGYSFNENYALELEYTDTDFSVGTLDADIQTYAFYSVFRTSGNAYAKFKLGILKEDISIGRPDYSFVGNDTGLSGGIGAGYRNGPVSIEAEYTIIEEDVDFFSLGLNYHFM